MSKSNPYSKGNTVNPKIFVKVTPDSTLIENNDKIDDILINNSNPNINIVSPDTSIKNNNLKPNTNVNIVTPTKQNQTDVFSIIEHFNYITTLNVQYIEYLRHKYNKNDYLITFLENFNSIYNNNNIDINFNGDIIDKNFYVNIIDTFLLIILHSSPLYFQLIRNVLFMSYYINLYELKGVNEIINIILNYLKGNFIFLIIQFFNDKRLIEYLNEKNEEIVINMIISIYRIDNTVFLKLLNNHFNIKNLNAENNDTIFKKINNLIMQEKSINKNFTNLKDKMTNFFCGYVQNNIFNFDIVNKDYLLNFLNDDNINNFCNEKHKKYNLFNIINDTVIYNILPNDTKQQTIGNDYRYIDLVKINNKIIKKICKEIYNKKLFYHFFLEIIVNHLFFDYFNDLKILNHSIKDDNLLLLFYIKLNKFFEWVVKNDEDKLCFPGIQSLINNKTIKYEGKHSKTKQTKKAGKKRKQIKTKKHYNKTKE
jgi:hypothetical protein